MESDKVKEKIIEALAEDDDLNEYVEIVRNVKGVEDFGDFLERLIGLSYYKLNWARGGHLSSCFKENYSYLNRNPNDPVAYFFNYSRDIPEALVKEGGIMRVRASDLKFNYDAATQVKYLDMSYSELQTNNINLSEKYLFEDEAECIIENECKYLYHNKLFFEFIGGGNKLKVKSNCKIFNKRDIVIILNGQGNKVDINLSSGIKTIEVQVENNSKDNIVHLNVPDQDDVFIIKTPFSKNRNKIIVNDQER